MGWIGGYDTRVYPQYDTSFREIEHRYLINYEFLPSLPPISPK